MGFKQRADLEATTGAGAAYLQIGSHLSTNRVPEMLIHASDTRPRTLRRRGREYCRGHESFDRESRSIGAGPLLRSSREVEFRE
jgi:hypothetical protein